MRFCCGPCHDDLSLFCVGVRLIFLCSNYNDNNVNDEHDCHLMGDKIVSGEQWSHQHSSLFSESCLASSTRFAGNSCPDSLSDVVTRQLHYCRLGQWITPQFEGSFQTISMIDLPRMGQIHLLHSDLYTRAGIQEFAVALVLAVPAARAAWIISAPAVSEGLRAKKYAVLCGTCQYHVSCLIYPVKEAPWSTSLSWVIDSDDWSLNQVMCLQVNNLLLRFPGFVNL